MIHILFIIYFVAKFNVAEKCVFLQIRKSFFLWRLESFPIIHFSNKQINFFPNFYILIFQSIYKFIDVTKLESYFKKRNSPRNSELPNMSFNSFNVMKLDLSMWHRSTKKFHIHTCHIKSSKKSRFAQMDPRNSNNRLD